jgi:hypothetical protein
MTVNLTGVADVQRITVTLSGVTDATGQVLPNSSVSMVLLIGDANGDRVVNAGDVLQTRSRSGQTTSETNFRSDVNTDGAINGGDALLVRSRSGASVPLTAEPVEEARQSGEDESAGAATRYGSPV